MNLKPIEINYLLFSLSILQESAYYYPGQERESRRSKRIEAKLKAELAYQKEIKKEAKI